MTSLSRFIIFRLLIWYDRSDEMISYDEIIWSIIIMIVMSICILVYLFFPALESSVHDLYPVTICAVYKLQRHPYFYVNDTWQHSDVTMGAIASHTTAVSIVTQPFNQAQIRRRVTELTFLPLAVISQKTFSNVFSWIKSFVFWFKFHWSLFLMV